MAAPVHAGRPSVPDRCRPVATGRDPCPAGRARSIQHPLGIRTATEQPQDRRTPAHSHPEWSGIRSRTWPNPQVATASVNPVHGSTRNSTSPIARSVQDGFLSSSASCCPSRWRSGHAHYSEEVRQACAIRTRRPAVAFRARVVHRSEGAGHRHRDQGGCPWTQARKMSASQCGC